MNDTYDIQDINGLPNGSQLFADAIDSAINDNDIANRYGIVHRPDMDSNKIFIGNIQIIGDENNDILSKDISVTGHSRDGVWKLLTTKQITKNDKFSADEINKYLLLLKTGGVEIDI